MNYVVVMPAHNEDEFIGRTLKSVCQQKLLPKLLVVVDDGSADNTSQIVQTFQNENPWLKLEKRPKSNRAVGSKVVETFNYGYKCIPASMQYDFIVKLDADLELPVDYFQRVSKMFQKHSDCGVCSGFCVIRQGDKWVRERTSPVHVRGPIKAVRREAFEDMGGFVPVMGWDGIDMIKLFYRGWKSGILDVPVKHFRPTGAGSPFKDLYFRMGRGNYIRGYDFFLTTLTAIILSIRRRKPQAFYHYLKGFLAAWKDCEEKVLTESEVKFFRKLQYSRLISEKKVSKEYAYFEKHTE